MWNRPMQILRKCETVFVLLKHCLCLFHECATTVKSMYLCIQETIKYLFILSYLILYSPTGSWPVNMGHNLKCCTGNTPSAINSSKHKQNNDWRANMSLLCCLHKEWHGVIWHGSFKCYQHTTWIAMKEMNWLSYGYVQMGTSHMLWDGCLSSCHLCLYKQQW